MKTTIVVVAAVVALASPASAQSVLQAAPPYALDGDDILIDNVDYRLEGVDAFEPYQTCRDANGVRYSCGEKAKAALQAIIAAAITAGEEVECEPTGKFVGQRLIANCTAGTRDIGTEIVRTGWAFARPDFLQGKIPRLRQLCAVEEEARTQKAGAWAGSFDLPYFQKRGHKKTPQQVSC